MSRMLSEIEAVTFPDSRGPDRISRNGVVQGILDLFDAPAYLEVGVSKGVTFNALSAARKVAVDPRFRFEFEPIAAADPAISFHQITSDAYFGTVADPAEPFDVIYLDGLHTFEQTLRDLINAIGFLKPDGVIVIDDVFPSSYAASLPDQRLSRVVKTATGVTSKEWMGDVFRLVFFIESFCQQFSYRTINDNHGQLVMWRQPRAEVRERQVTEVGATPYDQAILDHAAFRFAPYAAILSDVKAARG